MKIMWHGVTPSTIGEYFSKFVPSRCSTNSCPCILLSDQPLLQMWDHILWHCLQFERAWDDLEKIYPSLWYPNTPLDWLFSPSNLPALVTFLKGSAVFLKSQAPPLQEDTWMPPPQDQAAHKPPLHIPQAWSFLGGESSPSQTAKSLIWT